MSEIASMTKINHENLVKLYGGCVDGPSRSLVYEYMENNSLAQLMQGKRRSHVLRTWEARRKLCIGIARGLAYIHEEVHPHIVHRDIMASNIKDSNFNPKISDFGLSKLFHENITHISTRVAGTLGFLAPEYAISGRLTRKSDIYSFGVLLLEIASGRSAIDFDLELGEHYLVEKAWEMYKSEKLRNLVQQVEYCNYSRSSSTRKLLDDDEEEEAVGFLKIGLLCVQENSKARPIMSLALRMMTTTEINIDDVQVSPPAILHNIMDVKIAKRTSSTSSHLHQSP